MVGMRTTTKTASLTAALALALTACGPSTTVLEEARDECTFSTEDTEDTDDTETDETIWIGDEGETLTIQVTSDDAASLLAFICLQAELDMPERVSQRITKTRALDGLQSESWDDLAADWTYHPDAGLNLTIYIDNK